MTAPPAPALEFNEAAHAYTHGGRRLPSVTQVLQAAGILRIPPGVPAVRLEYARQRGGAVHLAVELASLGTLDPQSLSASLEGYLFAYEAFCAKHMGDFTPEHVEVPLACPLLRLAGRPDQIGRHRGVWDVLDVKAGAIVPPGTAVQTALYKLLARANGIPVVSRHGLHLKPDGTFQLHTYRDVADETEGRAALLVYHRRWAREKEMPI